MACTPASAVTSRKKYGPSGTAWDGSLRAAESGAFVQARPETRTPARRPATRPRAKTMMEGLQGVMDVDDRRRVTAGLVSRPTLQVSYGVVNSLAAAVGPVLFDNARPTPGAPGRSSDPAARRCAASAALPRHGRRAKGADPTRNAGPGR